jgi:hypothetical protein
MIKSLKTRLFLKINLLRVLAKFNSRFILPLPIVSKLSVKIRLRISLRLITYHFQEKKVMEQSPRSLKKLKNLTLNFLLQPSLSWIKFNFALLVQQRPSFHQKWQMNSWRDLKGTHLRTLWLPGKSPFDSVRLTYLQLLSRIITRDSPCLLRDRFKGELSKRVNLLRNARVLHLTRVSLAARRRISHTLTTRSLLRGTMR